MSRLALAAASAAVGLGFAGAAAWAVPPGGGDQIPGTPPGSVEVTTPEVPQRGDVGFCVRGFRVENGSERVGQQFMVKFDDHGAYGIGPFTPDVNGELCATVSTDPADHQGAKGGAADKIPSDLCDPAKAHWLRFLSGEWAQNGSPRSLSAEFRVTGACEPAGGGPGGGEPGGGTPPPAAQVAVRLRSHRLALGARRVTLRLSATGGTARGTIALRSAHRVVVGKRKRRVTLARGPFSVAPGSNRAVRVGLTRTGRRVLRGRRSLLARVTVRPAGGGSLERRVRLRRR